MEQFVARYRPLVTGVLSGFDRLVFRGHLLPLIRGGGMYLFLESAGVRLLEFKDFVTAKGSRRHHSHRPNSSDGQSDFSIRPRLTRRSKRVGC